MMKKNLLHAVLILTICLMQTFAFGQAPPLGATSSFALFTAAGAFGNNGATFVNGDIGTNVGAFTGFPPGTVIGATHVVDAVSAQAATDVAVAYSFLNGVTCGSVIGVTLGNNQTLTPGVYCIGAASTLNGDLYLDGLGNPNAIFIIKINGALATTILSHVILINAASLCNVYWQINGAVTLGDNSDFQGTILANGAISLLQGASLEGRGLSTAGAIALNTNTVNIAMSPVASTISASGTTTFCAGGSVILSGNNGGTWSTGAITPSLTVSTGGTYFVTNTSNCGSITSNSIIVTVNPLPIATITGGPITFCQGGSVILTASTGTSYLWSNSATTQSISVTTSGNYFVTVTNVNGCSATYTITTVTVNPSPAITVNGGVICSGNSVILSASGANTYSWSPGTGLSATTGASVTANPTTTTVYTVTGTNIAGCINTSTSSVTVVPNNLIVTVNTATICAGTSTTLIANGANTYSWSPATDLSSTTGSSVIANPTVTTVYTVTGSAGSCSVSATTTVVVNPSPIFNLGPDTTVCGCIILSAYSTGATYYNWSGGQIYSQINVCISGVYWVNVSNGICIASDTIKVTINPVPVVNISVVTTGTTVTLNAGNAGSTFLWNTGAITQTITADSTGIYFVTVTNQFGCTGYDTVVVNFSGVKETTFTSIPLKIYPNPSLDKNVTLNFDVPSNGKVEIRIINEIGILVYAEKLENFSGIYNKKLGLQKFASGLYFVEVINETKRGIIKIALE